MCIFIKVLRDGVFWVVPFGRYARKHHLSRELSLFRMAMAPYGFLFLDHGLAIATARLDMIGANDAMMLDARWLMVHGS